MPKRNRRQCRERWFSYLSPVVSNGPWTEKEEELLRAKVSEAGRKWRIIQVFFPGRTDINIKNHWKQMQRVRPHELPEANPEPEKDGDQFDQLMRAWLREQPDGPPGAFPDSDDAWMIWGTH
jgi:hypothetical protein